MQKILYEDSKKQLLGYLWKEPLQYSQKEAWNNPKRNWWELLNKFFWRNSREHDRDNITKALGQNQDKNSRRTFYPNAKRSSAEILEKLLKKFWWNIRRNLGMDYRNSFGWNPVGNSEENRGIPPAIILEGTSWWISKANLKEIQELLLFISQN